MIRVLVMANDSALADGIASMLAKEIDMDVVRLSHRALGRGDRRSVVIIVDEGESERETLKISDLFRDDITLLVIKLSLQSRNIFVYESYQLKNPGIDRVIELVRQFGRANLKKKVEETAHEGDLRKMTMAETF